MNLNIIHRIPFSSFYSATEPLAAYAANDPFMTQRLGGRELLLRRIADWPVARPNAAVATAIEEFNQQMGADALALEQARKLRDPRTVAVATGQQIGLLTGPFYALLKALTAVSTARWITQQTGRPAVALFWCLDEDHDYNEINQLSIPAATGLERLSLGSTPPELTAVGRHKPGANGTALLQALTELHRGRRAVVETEELLRATWSEEYDLLQWFARCLLALTRGAGLIVAALSLAQIKASLRPLARASVLAGPEIVASANRAGEELARSGFRQQVRKSATSLPFFLLSPDGLRIPLRKDAVHYAGAGRTWTVAELLEEFDVNPPAFSPGVLLNPVAFAYAVPTVAYVGGPGEAAYHAQLPDIFRALFVRQPTFIPRAGATIVNSVAERLLGRFGLTPQQTLDQDLDRTAIAYQERSAGMPNDQEWDALVSECIAPLARLEALAQTVDATLSGAIDKTRGNMIEHIGALRQRFSKAVLRREQAAAGDAARLRAWLAPNGGPQERSLSPFAFLFDEGLGFVMGLSDVIEPVPTDHLLLSLKPS